MPRVNTGELKLSDYTQDQVEWLYNGMDCALTFEIFDKIKDLSIPGRNISVVDSETYAFATAMQAPALEMMLRGFLVEQQGRHDGIEELSGELAILDSLLQRYAQAVWDKGLNANSPDQLKKFFYGVMKLPEQFAQTKGVKRVSTNRECLEKLLVYFYAQPTIECILAIRDRVKLRSVLQTEIDPDSRMRTSYNIAGTETARWSSSSSSTGTGTNLQNIPPKLRHIFIADAGMKICGIDLEQSESREVGALCGVLFNDWTYLDACESGDLHTLVCQLIWKNFPWTEDKKANRKIADQIFYREFSYRDMAKRGGHGCVTEDHEVLTRKGWVKISDKPDEIMTYAPGKSQFSPVSNWTDFSYTGTMCEFTGNSMSLLCTADHRIPYKKDQRYELIEQKAISGPGTYMPLGSSYTCGTREVPARLIAAFMSDGSQKSTNRMSFHLKKSRKVQRLYELCKLYGYEITATNDHYTIVGSFPKNPEAFMLNWTTKCITDFINEYKFWDGHESATAVRLFSTKKQNLEWIQTLGRLVGIGGAISRKAKISGFGSEVYTLQQNHRKYATGNSVKFSKTEVENLRVLCPTVPSTFFYVRRNGKIFVTGNSNYYGTPFTMARHLKVPTKLMTDFQLSYFGAFPAIPRWHRYVAQELQTKRKLSNMFGRTREFFGRPNDDSTLREAIAFCPQSSTAERLNLGLYRIWRHMGDRVQILAQVHDALYFQYPESADECALVSEALSLIQINQTLPNGRSFIIPGEAKVGWNWGNYQDNAAKGRLNLDGLKKFSPSSGPDSRKRQLCMVF
jgi:DNA polymerase I-like protein with 3'-5' exonuclease and polymerase domains